MYDSVALEAVALALRQKSDFSELVHSHWPLGSVLEKQLSIIRRFSSSNRSARLIVLGSAFAGDVDVMPGGLPFRFVALVCCRGRMYGLSSIAV